MGEVLAAEQPKVREVIQATFIDNLFVLPAGAADRNLTDLIFSPKLTALFGQLRQEFDIVLVDAPPALLVADARRLGREADGMVVVVRSGATDAENASLTLRMLADDGVQVLGTVLNDWRPGHQEVGRLRKYYSRRHNRAV